MLKRIVTMIAVAGCLIVAGCGGSDGKAAAVNACVSSSNASRSSCVCAVDRATAAGISVSTLMREMQDGTALNDRRVVTAALSCYKGA